MKKKATLISAMIFESIGIIITCFWCFKMLSAGLGTSIFSIIIICTSVYLPMTVAYLCYFFLNIKQAQQVKLLFICLFVLHVVMLYGLLLVREQLPDQEGFWSYIRYRTNFVPFKTVYEYIFSSPSLQTTIYNLLGNVVLFIPLGFLSACVFPSMQGLKKFVLVMCSVIAIVEILQLILLVGACDIDDVILNVFGCLIGVWLLRIPVFKTIRETFRTTPILDLPSQH